jgi:hypothetical protein
LDPGWDVVLWRRCVPESRDVVSTNTYTLQEGTIDKPEVVLCHCSAVRPARHDVGGYRYLEQRTCMTASSWKKSYHAAQRVCVEKEAHQSHSLEPCLGSGSGVLADRCPLVTQDPQRRQAKRFTQKIYPIAPLIHPPHTCHIRWSLLPTCFTL